MGQAVRALSTDYEPSWALLWSKGKCPDSVKIAAQCPSVPSNGAVLGLAGPAGGRERWRAHRCG
ncbi:hypothetical protein FRAHR75_560021 [Frankia sp. Hr75.2]|nr:hypothetical protein FRAHR75_560021 [Frankia sp. Hr75.2]